MKFTFKVRREKLILDESNADSYTLTVLDIFMDGISESIGTAHFSTYSDMGACLENSKLETVQNATFNRRAEDLYGTKSLYVAGQKPSHIRGGEAPKYPSRSDDSQFFDFGTIVVLDDIYFKGDDSRYEHLPVLEDDQEYWELVKQSLHFMIKHADASTLGWIMEFREYNTFPMLKWLEGEGFERLSVVDTNWKKDDMDKNQLVILR